MVDSHIFMRWRYSLLSYRKIEECKIQHGVASVNYLKFILNNYVKYIGSVNHNNNKSKGASTLSGKSKELRRIGLRSAEINAFDIGTCRGMQQVAEISEAARHKQIGYDQSIASEIKDIKVQLVEELTKEKEKAVEMARKLLVENRDLKDYLVENGLMTKDYKLVRWY